MRLMAKPIKSGPLCIFSMMVLIGQLGALPLAQAQPQSDLSGKNVLILHSFESNQPAFLGTEKGLSTVLTSGGIPILNQFFEFLDLRRNTGPEHRKFLAEQMRMRYGHRKIDLIITVYAEALEFVLKDYRDIPPAVPILALYMPQGFNLPKTDRRIVQHFPRPDVVGTLQIALKLVPGAKHVYIACGVHPMDRITEDLARSLLKKWEGPLEFHYLSHMPVEDMLATLSRTPPGSIILALSFSRDVTGRTVTTPEVVKRLSRISSAPIFRVLDNAFGYGIVGGFLFHHEYNGTRAGELALNILRDSKTPDSISAVLDVPSVPMFDWMQLRRWQLSEAALPKGSRVINREETIWDFKWHIMGVLGFCLADTALIVFLIVQRRRKKVAEDDLRQKKWNSTNSSTSPWIYCALRTPKVTSCA